MKYGEHLETESVPEWSLHNIDYNSLKHHIKVHTTRGQATAITIPGHQDVALKKFEDDFYAELCRQHDRLGLFVTSKADELSRRLQHISDCIHNTLRPCSQRKLSPRRRQRLARLEQQVLVCGDEIQALGRFVNAQVIAFRKILKKYKKWTHSQNLGGRFRENVLSDPKSFTNRDFHQLEAQYEDLLSELHAATPVTGSCPATPVDQPSTPSRRRSIQLPPKTLAIASQRQQAKRQQDRQRQPIRYWNEYDNGSEAGDQDGAYAIYVNPDEDSHMHFPGISSLFTFLSMPIETAKTWLGAHRGGRWGRQGVEVDERGPLLPTRNHPDGHHCHQPRHHNGPQTSYGTTTTTAAAITPRQGDADDDDSLTAAAGYSADEEALVDALEAGEDFASESSFPRGYDARYASLPSIDDQRIRRYRERVLFWGTIGADAAALVLLGVAAVLMMTGRHRLRVEVDAGVTVGVMASLGCACASVGMTLAREDVLSPVNRWAVYVTFCVICVLNGALLVAVMGNASL